MVIKTDVLVLRTVKLGDAKMIVEAYSRTYGRLAFVTALSKTGRSRVGKQLFQPLSLLSVMLDMRPRLSLQKLRDAAFTIPYVSIQTHPYKLSVAMFIAEFLYNVLRVEQGDEALFDYVCDSLLWLDACGNGGFSNFHLVFLMRLSRFLGFYPNLNGFKEGMCFDLRSGCFCENAPCHSDVLLPEEASKVRLMMRMDYPTMSLYRLSREERNRLLDVAVRYYAIHIPDFHELKSVEVLRELFH